jgi:hypothetical protein
MSHPISPWICSANVVSPDGRYRAIMSEAWEIAMGGPTNGTLLVLDMHQGERVCARVESCNPSFVWSADSEALAVPQWTPSRQQRLIVVSLPSGKVHVADGKFRVLELHSFNNKKVHGVDSPIYRPTVIDLAVEDLINPK